MSVVGLLRVQNEARWIERVVRAMLPLCESVLVMDDHSTDATPEICAAIDRVRVLPSPFGGLDEARDKNWLLDQARDAEWVLMIDGDELLAPEAVEALRVAMTGGAPCLAPRVLYLWDREDQVRVDGVYGRFRRPSLFRPGAHRFVDDGPPNFHCGNAPLALQRQAELVEGARLLHFGYLERADRLRKYDWYRQRDGANPNEDGYRHMVIGDVFPPESVFRHGGPLDVVPLADVCTSPL